MFTQEQLQTMIMESEFLGSGVSRHVYGISDNVALKVNSRIWDFEQTETELDFYDKWYDKFSDLLPELYSWIWYEGYCYVFMERVTPLDWYEEGYDSIYNYIDDNYNFEESCDLSERFALFENITGICDSSENEGNWGLRNGYPVLLDCGLTAFVMDDCSYPLRSCSGF